MEGDAIAPQPLEKRRTDDGEKPPARGQAWRFFASILVSGVLCVLLPWIAQVVRDPWWLTAEISFGALFFVFSQLGILAAVPAPRLAIRLPICAILWTGVLLGFFYLGQVTDQWAVWFWVVILFLHAGVMGVETLAVIRWQAIRKRLFRRFSLWSLIGVVTLIACFLGGVRLLYERMGPEIVRNVVESTLVLLPFMGVHCFAAWGPLNLMTTQPLGRRLLLWLIGVLLTVPLIRLAYGAMLWFEPDTSDAMFNVASVLAVQQSICFTLAALPLVGRSAADSTATDGG